MMDSVGGSRRWPTGTRRYVYDFEDILLEYDGANTLLARYTHGPGIDEPIAVTRGSSTYFYHADALGSVSELTDSGGAVAKSYSYDSFGNILDQSGAVENSYAYAGRELDSESGLYYFRTRYYDPRIGRFLRKDPVGLVAGMNLYALWEIILSTYAILGGYSHLPIASKRF